MIRRRRRLLWGSGGGGSSTLLDGLVSLWRLDETSGTRYDQVGSNDLTDTNTVLSGTGILGNAGSFVSANTEYLIKTDDTTLPVGDNAITVGAWAYWNSLTNSIVSKWKIGGTNTWFLRRNGASGKFNFRIQNGLTADVSVDHGTSVTTGAWFLVWGYHDPTNDVIGVAINDGAAVTQAETNGMYATANGQLEIGAVGTGQFTHNGLIDMVGVWSRVLTAAERAEYYNSGAGFDPTA